MQISFNLIDLLLILLILVGVALGIFLIVLIARLIKTLKHLSQLSADLHGPLTQTADQLPALISKIDSISTDAMAITGTARAGVEAVGSAAENISSGVASFFGPAQERPDNVSAIIGIVSQVLQIVGLFTHSDKAKNRKRRR